ncbi:MAG TPA: carbon storage regulator [Ktedonobacterales bacterium]
MLVLRRKAGEAIVLNGTITIHVLAVEGERVKLGINAPADVVIVRSELLEGGSSGANSSMPGAPVPPRESRPYAYRDQNGQHPYRDPEEAHSSAELPAPGRVAPGGAYGGTARYAPRRRMYESKPAPSTPLPHPNPRYR